MVCAAWGSCMVCAAWGSCMVCVVWGGCMVCAVWGSCMEQREKVNFGRWGGVPWDPLLVTVWSVDR